MSDNKGFLTETDRLYLKGQKQYSSKQQRYERRKSIRERTRGAFHDFALLFENLERSERNKIFDPPGSETTDLMESMKRTIAFLYQSLEGDAGVNDVRSRSFRYPFGQVLQSGVQVGEVARNTSPDDPWIGIVDVDFAVNSYRPEETDFDRVVRDIAENEGRGLTETELRNFIYHVSQAPLHLNEVARRLGHYEADSE